MIIRDPTLSVLNLDFLLEQKIKNILIYLKQPQQLLTLKNRFPKIIKCKMKVFTIIHKFDFKLL